MATIKNMHYDFKMKLNKLDSNSYRGLQIPQIDWLLNQALTMYILLVAEPRLKNQLGFEVNNRTTEDLRPIVVDSESIAPIAQGSLIYGLPSDYMFFTGFNEVLCSKEDCKKQKMNVHIVQHDDVNKGLFSKPDFNWRTLNAYFQSEGIRFTVDNFTIDSVKINYLKKHAYIHNAEDFINGTYTLPDGIALTGTQDCILPEYTHGEIVDLAVLLATNDVSLINNYQLKLNQLQLTGLFGSNPKSN
jgi:hypothetical protein